jgi:hypothetical protein
MFLLTLAFSLEAPELPEEEIDRLVAEFEPWVSLDSRFILLHYRHDLETPGLIICARVRRTLVTGISCTDRRTAP